ncbi:virulence protein RhuM/Fic/DOC family protein [Facilibium subflavum]|uniref:virulence protein RhuM/Fic/DOC family protein n=1 Tax=Facilibium subflavum TaxID=2219058 RepID=UPI000E64DB49|nr:virulence protein RhuM/Fic/DOC family protein [Facilibium subflavum]
MNKTDDVVVFNSDSGDIQVNVDSENETVWLSQLQMSQIFLTSTDNISLHIKNIYNDGELDEVTTTEEFSVVRSEGHRKVKRKLKHYNLDMIISVGYRVNSKKGIQFRQWANKILKSYLLQGYALNEDKLKKQKEQIKQLEKTLTLIQSVEYAQLTQPEASGMLSVLSDYTHSFILLNQYDSDCLSLDNLTHNVIYEISYSEAITAINNLKTALIEKGEATELFGNQKDNSFEGLLGNIAQSFGGQLLYQSVEEQAAHLLYFIIKNHPFTDGNKRIGAFMFVWFLEKNKHHLKRNGEYKVSDNALVAIALLVAQSLPEQKEIIIKLIINLIKGETKN